MLSSTHLQEDFLSVSGSPWFFVSVARLIYAAISSNTQTNAQISKEIRICAHTDFSLQHKEVRFFIYTFFKDIKTIYRGRQEKNIYSKRAKIKKAYAGICCGTV